MMKMEVLIEAKGLSKIYRRGRENIQALEGIDLSIIKGEFVAIVGPSGSGKTTLLNLLGCLDSASLGSLRINDIEITGLKESNLVKLRREYMGFVFQQFFLLPTLTVRENIELPLLFSKKKIDNSRIESILKKIGLKERVHHLPSQLSGGEMQRVAIGRALINEPRIIFADEPTGNLDFATGKKIFHLFHELSRQEGITVVLVTHNLKLADMTNRVIRLVDGRISHDHQQDKARNPPNFLPETWGTIKTEGLEKSYRWKKSAIKIISDVSFAIKPGESLLIEGASGSGKTTLLNLIGTLTRPSRGKIRIDGTDISHLPDHFLTPLRRDKIGFIFQQFNLLSGFTVAQNVMIPLIPLGLREKERKKRVFEILEKLGLEEKIDLMVNEISGGEQQRVAIARALINHPEIILADEPTSNLDRKNALVVLEILRELKEAGKTIVIASHDPLVRGEKWIDQTIIL